MWHRADLKNQAKYHLRGKYWMAFLVTFITGILASEGGGSAFSGSSYRFSSDGNKGRYNPDILFQDFMEKINWLFSSPWMQVVIAIAIAAVIFAIAYQIFVAGVIRAGSMRWFSRNRESAGTPSLSQMFSLFRKGRYLGTVRGMLWRGFWMWIWSTLSSLPILAATVFFILDSRIINVIRSGSAYTIQIDLYSVPGMSSVFALIAGITAAAALSVLVIAKSYSYFLVPWILADNPAIGARKALNLSKNLTRGSRFSMFVLDLSFIGWYLVGLLACCIGVIFVTPYHKATQTEMYAALRDQGVAQGLITMEDLGYRKAQPEYNQPAVNNDYQ